MKYAIHTLFASCALLASAATHAEIYMCKDASGKTITSDRPIPECSDRSMRVLGTSGNTKREIAAPMTAEEKKKKQEEEEKRKADAKLAEEQRRQDAALLARFDTEEDLERTRKRDIELLRDQMKRDELTLGLKEKSLQDVRKETAAYKGKTLPPALQRKVEDAEQAIADIKKHLAEKNEEIGLINQKYDKYLQRFRDLRPSATASASKSGKQ